ncbi:MFS transporter [Streptomyces sp. NPDC004237]|uniref:MFS transporter n=1 Tax=Streptomyces sp. NPDC004237 TaxID=3154455 RepID=UPI0033BEB40A
MVDGYAPALASLMLTSGTAGDRYGHRRVVLTGLAVFGAGSPVCGLAPGVAVLVGARVVQGAGAALLLPGTLAIIGRAFPDPAARAFCSPVPGSRCPPGRLRTPACRHCCRRSCCGASGADCSPCRRGGRDRGGAGGARGASAVNDTARRTGGAIGIAVAGAVAGPPEAHDRFPRGLHAVALGSAGLWLAAAVLVLVLLPGGWRDAQPSAGTCRVGRRGWGVAGRAVPRAPGWVCVSGARARTFVGVAVPPGPVVRR